MTIRPAAPDDYEAICEVLEEVDALHNADARRFYEQLGYTTLVRTLSKPLGDPPGS
jgi:hypothetical protein